MSLIREQSVIKTTCFYIKAFFSFPPSNVNHFVSLMATTVPGGAAAYCTQTAEYLICWCTEGAAATRVGLEEVGHEDHEYPQAASRGRQWTLMKPL